MHQGEAVARGEKYEAVTMQPLLNQGGMAQGPPGGAPPGQWMAPPPSGIPGCPQGLEYLAAVDQLLCHQIVEVMQLMTGWETNNKYVVKNTMGQQVFYVFEETNYCMRYCCGANRGFLLHVVNNYNQEVMRVIRPFKCCAGGSPCCGTCCQQELEVEAPPGTVIGRIRQACGCCKLVFDVNNADDEKLLGIEGPVCMCNCACRDIKFPVVTKDGSEKVGCIAKQWTGFVREAFTQADNFGIKFPMDLDVKVKATLLAATFLIDFMAFENTQQNR